MDSIGFSFTINDIDITTVMPLTTTSTSYSIAPATPYYFFYSGKANTMVTMTISGTQTVRKFILYLLIEVFVGY